MIPSAEVTTGPPPVSKKMVLNELMLPMKELVRYGVVTKTTYGSVILKNILALEAPSTVPASYKSAGIFIRIPEVINMVYGTPSHMLMIITMIFAVYSTVTL